MRLQLAMCLLSLTASAQEDPLQSAREARRNGQLRQADEFYRQITLDSADPTVVDEAAVVRFATGHAQEAEELLRKALAAATQPATRLTILEHLARVTEALGNTSEAELFLLKSIRLQEQQPHADALDLAERLTRLTAFYVNQHRWAVAEPIATRALDLYEQRLDLESPRVAGVLDTVAQIAVLLNHPDAAERAWRRALAVRETALGPQHQEVAQTLDQLGQLWYKQKRFAEAEGAYTRSLAVWRALLDPAHVLLAMALDNLAVALAAQDKNTAAEPLYREALVIREGDELRSLRSLAVIATRENDRAEAVRCYRRMLVLQDVPLRTVAADDAALAKTRATLKALAAAPTRGSRAGAPAALPPSSYRPTSPRNSPSPVPRSAVP